MLKAKSSKKEKERIEDNDKPYFTSNMDYTNNNRLV